MSTPNANLSVGQHYSGRIINFAPYGILVEIQPGVVGIVQNAVQESGMEVNDFIDVRVCSLGTSNEVFLERIVKSSTEAPAVSASASSSSDIKPWMGWKDLPTGHKQATTAMIALKHHTTAFKQELTAARKEWDDAKDQSQKIYDSVTASARSQCEDERKSFTNECNSNVQATEQRRGKATSIVQGCEYFIGNLPAQADNVKAQANGAMSSVRSRQGEVSKAIDAKIKAFNALRDCKIADSERVRNDKLDKARREQIDRDNQAEHRFETKNRGICVERRGDIYTGFNKATIKAYAQEVKSSRFNAASYECPTEIPDYVMLGSIGYSIPNQTKDDMSVVQAVEVQAADFGAKKADAYTVQIPYSQRLEDGISLMIRYSPNERTTVQGMMQPLLLKLFMSFPAGKLEATMIDPLELGASFPDIPKLAEGPNSARIIDTKIWSKERDIENAIATLRQRLENMTQAYGGDKESRLKKEVVRALAITDFPTGFSDTALKDLHAIVRNSASLGVCVLICANDDELEKLKQKNGTLVAEIAQSVVETKATGTKLMMMGAQNDGLFLQLDDMNDVLQNKDQILSQISGVIEHMQLKVEHFESMYKSDIYDSNNWFTGNHDEIAIPLGTRIFQFGAFVELAPGKEGMVHISKLAEYRIEKVEDVVNVGDMIWVKITEIDEKGRINLSHKDALREIAVKRQNGIDVPSTYQCYEESEQPVETGPRVGGLYNGKVTRILQFGAFVELAPGKEGMVHISKLAEHRIEKVEDVVNVGDMIWVKITEIDEKGRINLSHKDALREIEIKRQNGDPIE